ncbi:MAG: aminotransferase class I/II-fold pyridoxal phosphate-dependent enzyme [Candidatus Zixiibacteriota bacterium]
MSTLTQVPFEQIDDVIPLLARRVMTPRNMIHLFSDSTQFLSTLCKVFGTPSRRIVSAGHMTPDIALAADRAEMGINEVLGASAFSCDTTAVIEAVTSPSDIVYIANPNRISGANVSIEDLRQMAESVPDGLLIVDEYYFDFFGISSVPLLEVCSNVVVLRSLTAAFGLVSSDVGFAVAAPGTLLQLGISGRDQHFSATVRKTIVAALMNDQALANQVQSVHDESLRMATALNRMGARSRITATDSLLIRVSSTSQVGNMLARHRVPFENLDGYPRMQGFIKYRLQSPISNDKCLEAFSKMPTELLKSSPAEMGKQMLRRPAETLPQHDLIQAEADLSRHEVFQAIEQGGNLVE